MSYFIVKADDTEYVSKTREDGTSPKDLGIFNEALAYQLYIYDKSIGTRARKYIPWWAK